MSSRQLSWIWFFFSLRKLLREQGGQKKRPPKKPDLLDAYPQKLVFRLMCCVCLHVYNGRGAIFVRTRACPPSSVGSRSRFCCVCAFFCVCVWSWAGWVSRPSQMNRGWEEAWRGCRGWEAQALPKKLLLWDLCTFAFLTKHSAWLQRQKLPGGGR